MVNSMQRLGFNTNVSDLCLNIVHCSPAYAILVLRSWLCCSQSPLKQHLVVIRRKHLLVDLLQVVVVAAVFHLSSFDALIREDLMYVVLLLFFR